MRHLVQMSLWAIGSLVIACAPPQVDSGTDTATNTNPVDTYRVIEESKPTACATRPTLEGFAPVEVQVVAESAEVDPWSAVDLESIEVTSAEKFAGLFPDAPDKVTDSDWAKERIVVLRIGWDGNPYTLGWALEDSTKVMVGLQRPPYCSGAQPRQGVQLMALLLPADGRTVEASLCTAR